MPNKTASASACLLLVNSLVAKPIASTQIALPGLESVVVSGEYAHVMLPPRAVADSISELSWSGSGRYLVAFGVRPASKEDVKGIFSGRAELMHRERKEVYAYSQTSTKTQLLGSIPMGDWLESFWFPSSDVGVGFLEVNGKDADSTPSQFVVWLNPAGGRLRLAQSPLGGYPELVAATPSGSQAAIISTNLSGERRITVLASDGRTIASIAVEIPEARNPVEAGWISPEMLALKCLSRGDARNPNRIAEHYYAINIATGRLSPLGAKPAYQEAPELRDFGRINSNLPSDEEPESISAGSKLSIAYQKLKFGSSASVKFAYLVSKSEEEPNNALIAADSSRAELSPKEDAVAYLTAGVCLVRPIANLPKDAYLQMRNAALRAEAMKKAKQSALALLMYASDYDDLLPRRDGDWLQSAMPYAKTEDVLREFVFTFNGTSLAEVQDPAGTELGYVEGPGGRAVAYLDGHVKWIPYKVELAGPERSAAALAP